MSKNTSLSSLINYVSANSSGNVTIAAPSSGLALDVSGTGRFTGLITSNTGFATNAQNGYTLKNDANSANLGGLVRKKYWFGGTDDSPVIFAETGYSLGFYVDGSTTKGLSLATTGAATFSSSVTATGDIQSNGIYRDYQGEALIQTTTGAITQIGSLGAGTSRTIALLAGNSERMRITSGGNVNINTTSAYTSRLNVQAAAANRPAIKAGYGAVAGNGYWILGDNYTLDESLMSIGIDYSSGGLVIGSALAPSTTTAGAFISTQAQFGGYGSAMKLSTSGEIYFYNGTQNSVISAGSAKTASVAMTISQGGVLGVGVSSPSNWDGTLKAIEVGQYGNFYAGFNGGYAIYFGSNAYYNGGWKYSTTGGNAPILVDMGAGTFSVRNAPTGTANAALTFNTRFVVNNDGKVGIGTTSPAYNLSVSSFLGVGAQGGGDIVLIGGGSGVGAFIQLRYADGTVNTNLAGNGNSLLNTTYGNVLIGTTSDGGQKLQVNGTSNFLATMSLSYPAVNVTANTPLYWNNSNGNIGINTSSRKYKTDIVSLTKEQSEIALSLNPVEYTRIETGQRELGFIAEEVKEAGLGLIVPQINGECITIDYSKLSVIAIGMIKQQQNQIQELKAELDTLKNK